MREIEDVSSSATTLLKGEVIKSSMGATSCSSLLHFDAFYLEMNRRPLHNEGGEEDVLLKAEDVGGMRYGL